MTKTEHVTNDHELIQEEIEEIVSDLLYTIFQCMDEYVAYKIQYGNAGEDLTRMKNYIEKEMRKYAKGVYAVELEGT
ncbi:MAG: hypothetical protein J1F66_03505 [Clostridiales bacterium]|nr:hypothetical protein [Clostridiales bacterium]